MTDEKQDLANLTKHPGWLRAVEQGRKDIEGRVQSAMMNAVNERDDIMALNLLRQCLAAKQALEAFVSWPEARLKVLVQAEESRLAAPSLSRRGNL